MIFALAGNQNCGKTTLFNQLTGANQHVGNFPGVTVDQKMGEIRSTKNCSVVDLPGIYSIRPYTNEEIVTRDFILNEKPDGIINIVDATNIERNLYLTLQLLEMHIPMVLALNMMDEVRGNGGSIDYRQMSQELGIPVIPISAAKDEGIEDLIAAIVEVAGKKIPPKVMDFCEQGPVHRCIHAVSHQVEDHAVNIGMSPRFAATKIVENDTDIIERLALSENELEMMEHSIAEMEKDCGLDRNAALADMRYTFIEKVCQKTVKKCQESREHIRSVKIDGVLTNKYLAIPMFLLIMFLIFWLTFHVVGAALSDWLAVGIDAFTAVCDRGLTAYGLNPVVHSLLIDGVFAGVGSVLSFLPIIVTLFFFLSLLEDSGYMARVAYVMDGIMGRLGLSGRAFIPMILGFGCSVPALMASRVLENQKDRYRVMLVTPFMSCSARLPIYILFSEMFFGKKAMIAAYSMYVIGLFVAIGIAAILHLADKGENPNILLIELPEYKAPSARTVAIYVWEKVKDFVTKAGTTIFLASVIMWFILNFGPGGYTTEMEASFGAVLGKVIVPFFQPLGLGYWQIAMALIAGISAKEVVVTSCAVLFGISNINSLAGMELLQGQLAAMGFGGLNAYCLMIFCLLYIPCAATLVTIKKEMGGWKWALKAALFQLGTAWVVTLLVYQIGRLFVG